LRPPDLVGVCGRSCTHVAAIMSAEMEQRTPCKPGTGVVYVRHCTSSSMHLPARVPCKRLRVETVQDQPRLGGRGDVGKTL
jgi:hypothetical protein